MDSDNHYRLHGALLFALCIACFPAAARAENQTYQVGLFLPNTLFRDNAAAAGVARRVAAGLSAATGLKFVGRSYTSAGALSGAVARGQVDFAILDAMTFAGNMVYRPLASSAGRMMMSLFVSKGYRTVADLRGKVLVTPLASRGDANFYANYILQAEVIASKFFSSVVHRSNIAAALATVRSGRADAVFAYQKYGNSYGLRALYGGRKVSGPVFVLVNKTLPTSVISAVRSNLGKAGGGMFSWGAYDGAGIKAIRGAMFASTRRLSAKRPAMTQPKPSTLTLRREIFTSRLNYQLPPLRGVYARPRTKVLP